MTLFLGIDTGGTNVKAAIFDSAGSEVAARSAALANTHPLPGRTERDPRRMWEAAATAISQVLEAPRVDRRAVAAVCCTGHGNGAYFFDGNVEPTRPGIVSSDTRADALAARIMAGPGGAELIAWSEQLLRGCSTSVLMRWLDLHEPEAASATRHVLLCKDYVRFKLTGSIDSDLNDLSGSQLVHVRTGAYDERLLDALDVRHWMPALPPIRRNTDVSGTVTAEAARATGLLEGTPVAAGMMDLSAVTLASGVRARDELAISAGTWGISVSLAGDRKGPPWPLMRALDRDGKSMFICDGSPTSATNLAWLKDTLVPPSVSFDELNAMVEAVPAAQGTLVYLPYIHGEPGAPRASFVGFGAETGMADFIRAAFEGVVFKHLQHVRHLTKVTGEAPRVGRLSGGVTKSAVWTQIFADALNIPIEVAEGSEFGALGCAICAAVAVGEYPDFDDAVAAMTRVGRRFEPREEMVAVYREKLANWEKVDLALDATWREIGPVRMDG